MSPDIFFLLGLIIFALAFPAALSAFSSSNGSMRPVIACLLVGGGLIVFAMAQNPQGYSASDVPRIVMDLFR